MQLPTRTRSASTLEDYRWLTSTDAQPWLVSPAANSGSLAAQVARLRSGLSPERTHLVLEQIELRAKARAKFAAAERMFFAPQALEQATDEIVAAYKAQRFAARGKVFDLCCGIGGDMLALAARGETVGVDRDPVMAILAEANARTLLPENHGDHHDVGRCEVQSCDVADVDVSACGAWHIDPDRRPAGRRTVLVDLHEPGPAVIDRILEQNRAAAVKLAPAARMPPEWIDSAELEWISRAGQCRQLVAWFGDLAHDAGGRRATVLVAAGPRSIVGLPGEEPPLAERIGRYLFEPDAAVLAAKLERQLAAEHALAAIAPGVAYWTGDRPILDTALDCFAVREVVPFRVPALRAWLRSREIGTLEIKKRGVDLDPARLRRELNLAGPQSATLLVARIGKRVTAILADRVGAP